MKKKKKKKKLEDIFRFWDNCICNCCYKLSLLRREYLLSAYLFLPAYHVTFQSVLWNGTFLTFTKHVFPCPSVRKYISYEGNLCLENIQNWMSISKMQKKKKKKNGAKIFRFWDNCNWKCCNKFPLLRRESLSLAVNRLNNSPKILNCFFLLNCFPRDQ